MHHKQEKILELFENNEKIPLKLRWIARQIGEKHPQTIKYHLKQLEEAGFILIDVDKKEILKAEKNISGGAFASLPIMGKANCGSATALAEDRIEDFLRISKGLLQGLTIDNLFVLEAQGDSMNKEEIEGKTIENGDYVLVDRTKLTPRDGDCVVSIIGDYANIKNIHQGTDKITLLSNSTKKYSPIFITEGDPYSIAGEIVRVVKTPKF